MGKKKATPSAGPPPTIGPTYPGRLPFPVDVEGYLIESPPLCTPEQWAALGRPTVSIRYGMSYGDEIFGYTYCYTGLIPHRKIAARIITPSNCLTVDVGLITPAGEHWQPAPLTRINDQPAAADRVARVIGHDQPILYWDHLLSVETCARYLAADGTLTAVPQTSPGDQPDDPAALLRMADDGSPTAADPTPTTEDQ